MKISESIIDEGVSYGQNKTFWAATSLPLVYEKLRHDIDTDVLIIGGGISGLTTAYCLAEEGRNVTLLESHSLGSGETGRTTAQISYSLNERYFEIERAFGENNAMMAANSHMAALQWIDRTVKRENIDCNFKRVPGYLFINETDNREVLVKEYAATRRIGLMTEMLDYVPWVGSEEGKWCIKFPDQGQFHIMKYIDGLAKAVISKGGKIFTDSRAERITENSATANDCKIKANHIVVATNIPVIDSIALNAKQVSCHTYIIGARVRKGSIPYSLWWDTGKQAEGLHHYVRLEKYDNEYDLLISGGENHKTGNFAGNLRRQDRFLKLAEWTAKRFPIERIEYFWSGQVIEPVDYMAFIGRNPGDENVYIITGDSGNRITHGTIGGILISDLITGRNNSWEELYNPSRKPAVTKINSIHEPDPGSASENECISAEDIREFNELLPGQGAIITKGQQNIAAYRDESDNLFACLAICPHSGGILQWNTEEKSFDCPEDGSRFTAEGYVINGPAASDLKRLEIKEKQNT
jgi:glycine/D-amino acid oxidase-like deaminating enzyme/nitrite reductase/ring-hydroxylating ferredoxin subunit